MTARIQLPPLTWQQAVALVIALEKRHEGLSTLNQTTAVQRATRLTEEVQVIVDDAILGGIRQ